MTQEWTIQSRADKCAVTGEPFQDGEYFYTLLFEEGAGLRREDMSEFQNDEFKALNRRVGATPQKVLRQISIRNGITAADAWPFNPFAGLYAARSLAKSTHVFADRRYCSRASSASA